jgi:serine/threonine-protein kinase RsbW
MKTAFELKIRSDLEAVAPLASGVRAICEPYLDAEGLDAVELAVVEAVTNIIRHGYESGEGDSIRVLIIVKPDRVAFEIVDRAPPMDPTLLEQASAEFFTVDPERTDELPESGMGLALIKMNMDEVEYRPRPKQNTLRMVRRRRAAMPSARPHKQ